MFLRIWIGGVCKECEMVVGVIGFWLFLVLEEGIFWFSIEF